MMFKRTCGCVVEAGAGCPHFIAAADAYRATHEEGSARSLQALLDAARAHGLKSEPDHEVGDLQDILRSCWARLSPTQRREIFAMHKDLVDEWRSP